MGKHGMLWSYRVFNRRDIINCCDVPEFRDAHSHRTNSCFRFPNILLANLEVIHISVDT